MKEVFSQINKDRNIIEEVMRKYSGDAGAHFGFIAQADGAHIFFGGGRADIGGSCIAEGIANLVRMTPGLTEEYIDKICTAAHEILNGIAGGVQ